MRITRKTTEKLHDFAFKLARQRKSKGKIGKVTCVDKANVFRSQAFFRKIFDERKVNFEFDGEMTAGFKPYKKSMGIRYFSYGKYVWRHTI